MWRLDCLLSVSCVMLEVGSSRSSRGDSCVTVGAAGSLKRRRESSTPASFALGSSRVFILRTVDAQRFLLAWAGAGTLGRTSVADVDGGWSLSAAARTLSRKLEKGLMFGGSVMGLVTVERRLAGLSLKGWQRAGLLLRETLCDIRRMCARLLRSDRLRFSWTRLPMSFSSSFASVRSLVWSIVYKKTCACCHWHTCKSFSYSRNNLKLTNGA